MPGNQKNKIVRTVGNIEHVLYEVSAEIVTVLQDQELFQTLFRGVEGYMDRIVTSLSHTQSEAQRASAAQALMRDLWRTNMIGGPYPVPSLLPEFEFSRLFYPRYRDHTVHQLRVLLLGLYLYIRNRTLRDAVRTEMQSCAAPGAASDNVTLDKRFLIAWLLTATYHDQGYVFEIDAPPAQRGEQLAKVFHEFNDFLAAPLHRYLKDYLQVPLDKVTEQRARFGLRLPQPFCAGSFDEMLFEPDGQSTVIDSLNELVSPCQLGSKGALASYLDMARHNSSIGGRAPYIDHGIASAVLLLRAHNELSAYVLDLAGRVPDGSLGRFISSGTVQQAIQLIAEELQTNNLLVRHAAAAIAIHNIDRTAWEPAIFAGPRYRLTLSTYGIALVQNPLAFLLVMADTLQDWDRPRFVLPAREDNYITIDQQMLITASDAGVAIRISPTIEGGGTDALEKIKDALIHILRKQDVLSLLDCRAPAITRPEMLSTESIDELAAKRRLEDRHRYEKLVERWELYKREVDGHRVEGETEVALRSRRIRTFRLFLEWCGKNGYDYLRPSPVAELTTLYSLILAEVNDLNFVMVDNHVDGRRLVQRIGSGGYGTVFEAHRPDGTREALKVLHTDNFKTPELAERFRRGFDSMKSLDHPQITRVYEFIEVPRGYYMEFIEGDNLALVLRQLTAAGPLYSVTTRIALLAEICRVLQYAHGQGIIHRDIKPENILMRWSVERNGFEPVLTDFDLAWFAQAVPITASGAEAIGSILYAAPEQKRLKPDMALIHRPTVDVFSMGRLMYFLLTGHPPEDGIDLAEALYQTVQHRFSDVPAKSFAWNVRKIYRKATHVSPDRRHQSIAELRMELDGLESVLWTSGRLITQEAFLFEVAMRLNAPGAAERDEMNSKQGKLRVDLGVGHADLELVRSAAGPLYANVRVTLLSGDAVAMAQKGSYSEAREVLNSRMEKILAKSALDVLQHNRGGAGEVFGYSFKMAVPQLGSAELAAIDALMSSVKTDLLK